MIVAVINAITLSTIFYLCHILSITRRFWIVYIYLLTQVALRSNSKEVFDLCQDIRQGRGAKSNAGTNKKKPFIFRGLVRCKHCGRLYSPELKKNKYVYLRPAPVDGCSCKPLTEIELLTVVEDTLKKMYIPAEMLAEIQAVLKTSLNEKISFAEKQIAMLRKRYDEIQKKLDALLDVRLENSITKDEYDKKALELRTEQANIKNDLNNIDKADEKFSITLEYLISLASKSYELFKSSKTEEKRQLIKFVFSNFEIDGKNIEFSIRKPFDKLLNLSKGQIWLRLSDCFATLLLRAHRLSADRDTFVSLSLVVEPTSRWFLSLRR